MSARHWYNAVSTRKLAHLDRYVRVSPPFENHWLVNDPSSLEGARGLWPSSASLSCPAISIASSLTQRPSSPSRSARASHSDVKARVSVREFSSAQMFLFANGKCLSSYPGHKESIYAERPALTAETFLAASLPVDFYPVTFCRYRTTHRVRAVYF